MYDKLSKFSADVTLLFNRHLKRQFNPKHRQNFEGWVDKFWESGVIRKCHLKTIDLLEQRNLWLLHINIFPHDKIDLPILGCDIVAGPTKISGAFFDFSPIVDENHQLMQYFAEQSKKFSWKKPRELPDWGKVIFSEHMIAAGAVKNEETTIFLDSCAEMIEFYLENMNEYAVPQEQRTIDQLNRYCVNQKKNKRLHDSILAMGIDVADKNYYVENVLFEEVY